MIRQILDNQSGNLVVFVTCIGKIKQTLGDSSTVYSGWVGNYVLDHVARAPVLGQEKESFKNPESLP